MKDEEAQGKKMNVRTRAVVCIVRMYIHSIGSRYVSTEFDPFHSIPKNLPFRALFRWNFIEQLAKRAMIDEQIDDGRCMAMVHTYFAGAFIYRPVHILDREVSALRTTLPLFSHYSRLPFHRS
jgi:hypothetical protein